MFSGSFVSRMDFNRIVSTQPHARKLIVGKMLDHLQQPGIGSKEVLPEISSTLDEEFLILSVGDFAKAFYQQAIPIVLEERIPIRAPNALNDVPSGAAEDSFQLLNDLAVAAHRTIETL